jgi:3-oxoacyl-[acyl-carrier protein] reductase
LITDLAVRSAGAMSGRATAESKPLDGLIAVVTAAAGLGIGGSVARRLHADGARVIVSDAHPGRIEKICGELGIQGAALDVADPAALADHLANMQTEHGRIDILVNCAGANVVKPTWELSDSEWMRVLDVNLTAAFRAARIVLPGMITRRSGVILSIASIAAWTRPSTRWLTRPRRPR